MGAPQAKVVGAPDPVPLRAHLGAFANERHLDADDQLAPLVPDPEGERGHAVEHEDHRRRRETHAQSGHGELRVGDSADEAEEQHREHGLDDDEDVRPGADRAHGAVAPGAEDLHAEPEPVDQGAGAGVCDPADEGVADGEEGVRPEVDDDVGEEEPAPAGTQDEVEHAGPQPAALDRGLVEDLLDAAGACHPGHGRGVIRGCGGRQAGPGFPRGEGVGSRSRPMPAPIMTMVRASVKNRPWRPGTSDCGPTVRTSGPPDARPPMLEVTSQAPTDKRKAYPEALDLVGLRGR